MIGMLFAVTSFMLSLTLTLGFDCVCPINGAINVYTIPYSHQDNNIFGRKTACMIAVAYHHEWYSVMVDGKIAFIHDHDIIFDEQCEMTFKHRQERFLIDTFGKFFELMKLPMEGTAVMGCAVTCKSCHCNGTATGTCDDDICKPCISLLCFEGDTAHTGETTSTHTAMTTHTTTLHQILTASVSSTVDHCSSSPCLNGGICQSKGNTYECFCKSTPDGSILYSGNKCELQIDLSKTHSTTVTSTQWLVIHGK